MSQAIFRPAAAAEVEEAYLWYEEQNPGLGDEFLQSVGAALTSLSENPLKYPVIHRQTRRILLHRFPYGLFYRIIEDQVVIVACMHARRNPKKWRSR